MDNKNYRTNKKGNINVRQKVSKVQAVKPRSKIKKENNNVETKKSTGSKLLAFFKLIFVIAFIGMVGFLIYFGCTSSAFNISNIVIEGNEKYATQEIKDKIMFAEGKNIFLTNKKALIKEISNLPYIESVKIKKEVPNNLKVVVEERVSVYFAYNKEKNIFYKLDGSGIILEECNIDKKTETEVLTYGITFNDKVELGTRINETDISKLVIYQNILEKYNNSAINLPITKLNFENSLTIIVLNDKISIILPNDTNIDYNIIFLKNILKNIAADVTGVIDMTKSNPTFRQE